MRRAMWTYDVPDAEDFTLLLPAGATIVTVARRSALGADHFGIVTIINPETKEGEEVDFMIVPARHEFDPTGWNFVGEVGIEKYLWVSGERRPYVPKDKG